MKITVNVPEQYADSGHFGRKVALSAALWMYRSGELSAGAAAELAGIDRLGFWAECQRHGIPVIDYDPEELRAELGGYRSSS